MTAAALLVEKEFFNRQALAAWVFGVALDRLQDDDGRYVFFATLGPQTRRFESLELFDAWLYRLPVTPSLTLRAGAS